MVIKKDDLTFLLYALQYGDYQFHGKTNKKKKEDKKSMKIQIGVLVNGSRQITIEQAGIFELVRKEYARLFNVDENSIFLSLETIEKKESDN